MGSTAVFTDVRNPNDANWIAYGLRARFFIPGIQSVSVSESGEVVRVNHKGSQLSRDAQGEIDSFVAGYFLGKNAN